MSEQQQAAAEMTRLGWRFRDMGYGFHVNKFGNYKTPREILNHIEQLVCSVLSDDEDEDPEPAGWAVARRVES